MFSLQQLWIILQFFEQIQWFWYWVCHTGKNLPTLIFKRLLHENYWLDSNQSNMFTYFEHSRKTIHRCFFKNERLTLTKKNPEAIKLQRRVKKRSWDESNKLLLGHFKWSNLIWYKIIWLKWVKSTLFAQILMKLRFHPDCRSRTLKVNKFSFCVRMMIWINVMWIPCYLYISVNICGVCTLWCFGCLTRTGSSFYLYFQSKHSWFVFTVGILGSKIVIEWLIPGIKSGRFICGVEFIVILCTQLITVFKVMQLVGSFDLLLLLPVHSFCCKTWRRRDVAWKYLEPPYLCRQSSAACLHQIFDRKKRRERPLRSCMPPSTLLYSSNVLISSIFYHRSIGKRSSSNIHSLTSVKHLILWETFSHRCHSTLIDTM